MKGAEIGQAMSRHEGGRDRTIYIKALKGAETGQAISRLEGGRDRTSYIKAGRGQRQDKVVLQAISRHEWGRLVLNCRVCVHRIP